MIKTILIAFIRFYAFLVSPVLGRNCRFHPTCSAYAVEAIEVHGALKGGWLAIKRIGKCHPWHSADYYDAVPESLCADQRYTNKSNKDNKAV